MPANSKEQAMSEMLNQIAHENFKSKNEWQGDPPTIIELPVPMKGGTHEAIDKEMKFLHTKINELREIKCKIPDEPILKQCPRCKTLNYHYYADKNNWCCAFC
jgi:hypothetical protein